MLPDYPAAALWVDECLTPDEPIEDGDFLAELERAECVDVPCDLTDVGVVKDCVVEALEIGGDSYQWWRFNLECNARRQPAADLLWWNGYDGVVVGIVREEETGFLGAARLDRRDETSGGLDVLGIYASLEKAQRAVAEALRDRWHTEVDWRTEGF